MIRAAAGHSSAVLAGAGVCGVLFLLSFFVIHGAALLFILFAVVPLALAQRVRDYRDRIRA